MKIKRILGIIGFILLLFLALSENKTKAEDTQPKIRKCWHIVCTYYEGGCFNGNCAEPRTLCELEVEDCDGRSAEIEAVE